MTDQEDSTDLASDLETSEPPPEGGGERFPGDPPEWAREVLHRLSSLEAAQADPKPRPSAVRAGNAAQPVVIPYVGSQRELRNLARSNPDAFRRLMADPFFDPGKLKPV